MAVETRLLEHWERQQAARARERRIAESWGDTRDAAEVYEQLSSILEKAKQTQPLYAVTLAHDDR